METLFLIVLICLFIKTYPVVVLYIIGIIGVIILMLKQQDKVNK